MPAKKAPAKKTTKKLLSWNDYVKKHKGKGLTMSDHSKNYRKSRSASPAKRSASLRRSASPAKRSASLRRSPCRIAIRDPSRGYFDYDYTDDMYDTETDEEKDDDFYASFFDPKPIPVKPVMGAQSPAQWIAKNKDRAKFIPSSTPKGSKYGYVFKTGQQGTGYYSQQSQIQHDAQLRYGLHGDDQQYQNVPRHITQSNARPALPQRKPHAKLPLLYSPEGSVLNRNYTT